MKLGKKHNKKPFNYQRFLIVTAVVVYIIIEIISAVWSSKPTAGQVTLEQLNEMIDNGEVASIQITKNTNAMLVTKTDGTLVDAVNPQNDTFIYDLMSKGINITVQKTSLVDALTSVAVTVPMTLVMIILAVYLLNTTIGGNIKKFTVLDVSKNKTTFDDIKGLGETKEQIKYVIEQIKNSDKLEELGARPCKGILLYGPPGNGKTLIAKAIAKEAGVNFISASGADFSEMFVGVGAARVKTLWNLAVDNSPCVIFIDEIDCLGQRRSSSDGAINENNQTINALLQKMDGVNATQGILVIGATNRKDDLDSALVRPGRFDRQYFVGLPTNKSDRDEIINYYLSNKKLGEDIDRELTSKLLSGLSGAEIEQTLNQAVYISLQDNRDGIINMHDIDKSLTQMLLKGVEVKQYSKKDLEIAAIHEAGHTLVALLNNIPVVKVTVIPYSSGAGGHTKLDISSDDKLMTKEQLEVQIKILLGGMIAEDVFYGTHTNGCSSDLNEATKQVYLMLTSTGYNKDKLLNYTTLINQGIIQEADSDILNDCNNKLAEFVSDTHQLLQRHLEDILKIKKALIEEQTILNPTLESIRKL